VCVYVCVSVCASMAHGFRAGATTSLAAGSLVVDLHGVLPSAIVNLNVTNNT